MTVEISKFLDTSLIDVDVHPDHVVVTIKGKILRLLFDVCFGAWFCLRLMISLLISLDIPMNACRKL